MALSATVAKPDAAPLHVEVSTKADVPAQGTKSSPAVYGEQWFVWGLIACLVAGAALGAFVTWRLSGERRAVNFRIAAVAGFFVALIGAAGHAVFVNLGPAEKFVPLFDQTTLLWAAVAIVALMVPFLSEFSFGGASFKVEETKDVAEDAVANATGLARNWLAQTSQFLAELETTTLGTEFVDTLFDFLELRTFESLEWIDDGERRRLSLWLYDERTDDLSIYFSDGISDDETKRSRVARGAGIVGTVYKLQQTWNERDAPSLPVWIPLKGPSPRYHGIFLTPVNYRELKLGVLCVDRVKRESFSPEAEDVFTALATIFGIAIGNEKAQQLLLNLPEELRLAALGDSPDANVRR